MAWVLARKMQEPAQAGTPGAAATPGAAGSDRKATALADLRGALALLSMAAAVQPETVADHLELLLRVCKIFWCLYWLPSGGKAIG